MRLEKFVLFATMGSDSYLVPTGITMAETVRVGDL